MEGNKLILTQKAMKAGEKDVLDVMEFTEDGLTMTWTTEGAICTQVFKRTQQLSLIVFHILNQKVIIQILYIVKAITI